jgi:hypothetical protein
MKLADYSTEEAEAWFDTSTRTWTKDSFDVFVWGTGARTLSVKRSSGILSTRAWRDLNTPRAIGFLTGSPSGLVGIVPADPDDPNGHSVAQSSRSFSAAAAFHATGLWADRRALVGNARERSGA